MHILSRISGKEREDDIEGVILDPVGLSVFSGSLSEDSSRKGSIRFQKTYSRAAVAKGGFENIRYEGKREIGGIEFVGHYQIVGTGIQGSFILGPFSHQPI